MAKTEKRELQDCDKLLFKRMKKEAVSENERFFFQEMLFRQQNHPTARDWLLFPDKTEAKVGFFRLYYDWYMLVIGEWGKDGFKIEYESLDDFLFDDWSQYKEINLPFRTMLEYLRSIDYVGVDYHADQDWE